MTVESQADKLLRFARKRGVYRITYILNSLNKKIPQKVIAEEIGMDPGQFSTFLSDCFECTWHIKPELDYICATYLDITKEQLHHATGVNAGKETARVVPFRQNDPEDTAA